MTVHRVYFAFDYTHDLYRVARIHKLPNIVSRAAGGFENATVWRRAKRRGRAEIQGLINDALIKTSVTVVCVGHMAAFRTYLDYEVKRSLEQGNGLVGLRINHLENVAGVARKDGTPPPLIEAAGYHVYRYRGPERLIVHIEEAHELAQMGEAERVALWHQSAADPWDGERRSEARVKIPEAQVWIDGEPYSVKNWNSLGFSASQYTGPRQEGERFRITFATLDADLPLEFDCEANVFLRYEDQQELVCLFVALDGQAKTGIARSLGPALATH
jgi:hypothetical protein